MDGGGKLEGRGNVSVNTIVQTSIAVLLALTGFLMQTKLSDVTEELKSIAQHLRAIEERNYKLSERSALVELRVDELEKRVRFVTKDYVMDLEVKKKTAP